MLLFKSIQVKNQLHFCKSKKGTVNRNIMKNEHVFDILFCVDFSHNECVYKTYHICANLQHKHTLNEWYIFQFD